MQSVQYEESKTFFSFNFKVAVDRSYTLNSSSGLITAAEPIEKLTDAQHVVHGIPKDNFALFGWSEAGSLALATCLLHRVAACVNVSGPLLTTVIWIFLIVFFNVGRVSISFIFNWCTCVIGVHIHHMYTRYGPSLSDTPRPVALRLSDVTLLSHLRQTLWSGRLCGTGVSAPGTRLS